jgi:hypothetical protein
LPPQAAAAGVEPAIVSLTGSRLTVRPHRNESVRAAGFEPALSCARGRRNPRLSHALISKSAQRESNPHFHHGKAAGSRYIMGASNHWSNCQRSKSTGPLLRNGVRFEPTSPHYGCGILAAGLPVPVVQLGSEGLEPSPTWLRARHAATSTLIPIRVRFSHSDSARRESNPRPGPYKRPALTTEPRASGAEGSRTLTIPLKRRKRYRYATTPSVGVRVCV